jgi:periplasmic protein TonB
MTPTPEPTRPRFGRRPRRLPATGLPVQQDRRRRWTVLSVLMHILVLILATMDWEAPHTGDVVEKPQGASGLGPAGGGGGGHRGTGGVPERVNYVRATPPPAPTPQAVIPPPTPVPQPVVVPPPQVKPPEVIPELKVTEAKPDARIADATAPIIGTGGGTGRDGTNGTGPGTGGGVGSGNGTGRGSGNGPGTGGGVQENYPPTPIELFIPPLPFPAKLRGFHLVAEFDVDESGKVLDWKFTSTRDGGYDRRLNDVLKGTRFRPGTTPEGKPIRMKAQIVYDF